MKLTLDAFGQLTFGLEFNALTCEGPNEFGDAFDYLTANVDGRVSNPFWFLTDKITPGKTRQLRGALGVLEKFAKMAIEKRRNESVEEKEKRRRDLLDHFINHVAEDGTKLTDVELRDVFVNFMMYVVSIHSCSDTCMHWYHVDTCTHLQLTDITLILRGK